MRVRSLQDVAATARGRRKDLRLSQGELAERIGVSRKWIGEFEAGKPTAEFGMVLRVLEELGISLDLDTGPDPASAWLATSRLVDLDALLERHRDR